MKFNNKIKALSLFVILSASTTLLADPIIVLSENKNDYTQTETGYVLNFDIEASAIEIDKIHADALELNAGFGSNVVTITTELIAEGQYKCTYTVDHQNQPEYVHKMLLTCGFNEIRYQDQAFGLDKIIEILYSFQD